MRIGAHVSIASGIYRAVERQRDVGGTCGQIFTHSPRVWAHPTIEDEEAAQFKSETAEKLDGPWVIHSCYLVNLSTPKADLREKSLKNVQADIDAAEQLSVPYVNVHLGAHTGSGVEAGLDAAIETIDQLSIPDGVTLLLETDAGSGTKLGAAFEELETVRAGSHQDLGICLDTAHVFVAGYDLTDVEAVDQTVEEFDRTIGLENLHAVHLNDSKFDCGTHKDEHAHLGDGEIGNEGIASVLNHPDLEDRPFILETPTDDEKDFAWNIEHARSLRD